MTAPGRPITGAGRACTSRARFPANDRERAAAEFILSCRTRGAAITYEKLVDLLNKHYPGVSRSPRGVWTRFGVRRVVLRAHAVEPLAVVRHVPRAKE